MITLLNLSQEERCCDLITRPPREQGMGVRETCLADVLFLRFNCELAGRVRERKQHCLPPGSLQVLLVGVRYSLRSTGGSSVTQSPLRRSAWRSLLCLTWAWHCQRALPKSISTACCQVRALLHYGLQTVPCWCRPAAAWANLWENPRNLTALPILPTWRETHVPQPSLSVFTGRLEKQQVAASVWASKNHKYPLNNPAASCRPRARSCVFKKFMGPALLWNAKKQMMKPQVQGQKCTEDSLGLRWSECTEISLSLRRQKMRAATMAVSDGVLNKSTGHHLHRVQHGWSR